MNHRWTDATCRQAERETGSLAAMANDHQIALRIADANFNRVLEGLRTLEDIARFMDRCRLQAEYKGLRHAVARCLTEWDRAALLAARDAQGDVGRTEKASSEADRSDGIVAIASSAAGRSEQGLRVLEEFAKLLAPTTSPSLESIRYRMYDINAQLLLDLHRDTDFLRRAKLYVLVDCQLQLDGFVERVLAISAAGVDIVQIRDKSADVRRLAEYAVAAAGCLDRQRTRLIVNDRADVAATVPAWGVHVGQEDLAPKAARSVLQSHQVLGFSTHTEAQIDDAIASRVDYIGCGPTFPSSTKGFASYAGTEFLRDAAHHLDRCSSDLPAFAIGGIAKENLNLVLDSGFQRVAVGASVWSAPDPVRATKELREVLDASRCGREG